MNNHSRLKPGIVLICTNSTSIAYTQGEKYTVAEHNGTRGLIGNDGLFDPFSLLISEFKVADATVQALSKIKVVK